MSNLSQDQIDTVQNLLQDLVAYLLLNKPEDPIPHMVQFLNEKQGKLIPGLSKDERAELNDLRE
jgi:hypothetical protein